MLSSVLILKNSKYDNKDVLLIFDFKYLEISLVINNDKIESVSFEDYNQLFTAFIFFACKEEWIFYEV